MINDEKPETDNTLVKLRQDYLDLRDEFENLISFKDNRSKSRMRGSITSAGTTLETILKYILVKEGKAQELKNNSGKFVSFNEIRKLAEIYIPKEENLHVTSIMLWRNQVAHPNDIDKFNQHELATVNSALNSFVEWFFTDYLDYKLPEFSNNKYINKEEPQVNEQDLIKKEKAETEIDISNFDKQSSQSTKKRLSLKILISALLIFGVCFFFYRILSKPKLTQIDKGQVYELLIKYYTRINNANFDSREFFAESVSQFITYRNITPEKINDIISENVDYIDGKTVIDRESIHKVRTEGNIVFWEYNIQFLCYRKSLNKFQNCKVEVELGLTYDNKIESYKELKVKDLRFSDKKFN